MNCFLRSADSQEAVPAGAVLGLCHRGDVPTLDGDPLSTQKKRGGAEAKQGKTQKGGDVDSWDLSCFEAKLASSIKLWCEVLFHPCSNARWSGLLVMAGLSCPRQGVGIQTWFVVAFYLLKGTGKD